MDNVTQLMPASDYRLDLVLKDQFTVSDARAFTLLNILEKLEAHGYQCVGHVLAARPAAIRSILTNDEIDLLRGEMDQQLGIARHARAPSWRPPASPGASLY